MVLVVLTDVMIVSLGCVLIVTKSNNVRMKIALIRCVATVLQIRLESAKDARERSVAVERVLLIAKLAIRRFAGIALLSAGVILVVVAVETTALIAPMNLLLNSLAHALNATKSLATFADQWNQNVQNGAGVLGASGHLATLGKRRRRSLWRISKMSQGRFRRSLVLVASGQVQRSCLHILTCTYWS